MDEFDLVREAASQIVARLANDSSCLFMAAGAAFRARAAVRSAMALQGTLLAISSRSDLFRPGPEDSVAGSPRFGLLPAVAEAHEFSMRLAQYQAGAFGVFGLLHDQAWLAEVALAITARPPRLIAIDVSSLASGRSDGALLFGSLVGRLRPLAPGVPLLALADPLGEPSTEAIGAILARVARSDMLSPQAAPTCPGVSGPNSVIQLGAPVPDQTSLRYVRLRQEPDRLHRIRHLCARGDSSVLVVAPGRAAAARLQARLADFGLDCGLYHAGLTRSERAALLAAHGEGRLQTLVATEAVAGDDRYLSPAQVVFSHPPTAIETLVRFASLTGAHRGPAAVTVLFTAPDLPDLAKRAQARVPTIGDARESLRYLLSIARQGYAHVPGEGMPDALAAAPRPRADQFAAALAVLEAAGYCARRDYLPRAASLGLGGDAGPTAGDDLKGVGSWGRATPIQPLQFALRQGLPPDELQRRLLVGDQQGSLVYRGHGRDRLYHLARPRGGPDAVRTLLAGILTQAERGAELMIELLAGQGCRVRRLSAALHWPDPGFCGRCDQCRHEPGHPTRAPTSDGALALMALAGVPFSMRRGAIHRVVAGALRGAGRSAERPHVSALVDELLLHRLIEVLPGQLGDLFAVSQDGRATLEGWDRQNDSESWSVPGTVKHVT